MVSPEIDPCGLQCSPETVALNGIVPLLKDLITFVICLIESLRERQMIRLPICITDGQFCIKIVASKFKPRLLELLEYDLTIRAVGDCHLIGIYIVYVVVNQYADCNRRSPAESWMSFVETAPNHQQKDN